MHFGVVLPRLPPTHRKAKDPVAWFLSFAIGLHFERPQSYQAAAPDHLATELGGVEARPNYCAPNLSMLTQTMTTPEDLLLQRLMEQGDEAPPVRTSGDELNDRVKLEIKLALERIDDPVVLELADTIFDGILRAFTRLNLIGTNLHKLDTLMENLSILEVLHFEIRYLLEYLEAKAMNTPGISERLQEVFDGISYGISHDVKRVFERELVGDIKDQSTPVVYGKILHTHGLLTNCFQQSLITLLQVFNPRLDPFGIFDDFEERLRQSLLLCNDLAALMRVVRHAEAEPTPDFLHTVVQHALKFRDGSMQYLMYRDWRGYERLALALITSIETNGDSKDLLHQFACFLEVLYGHVKMRAVLRELFPSSNDESEVEIGS